MVKVSFSDSIGVGGIVLAIVLVVLDKAGKLKGGWLYGLLVVAAMMTLFLAIGNAWVMDAPAKWKLWRAVLMFCIVGFAYSGVAIWISDDKESRPSGKAVEAIPKPSEAISKPPTETKETRRKPKALVDFVDLSYAQINTPKLIEGGDLKITVHTKITGRVHDFLLSPNVFIAQFNKMPITEKDEIYADAWIRKRQAERKRGLRKVKIPPDVVTSSFDAFQTAVYPQITTQEVEGLVSGATRIYLLTFIFWKDQNNTPGDFSQCLWLQKMPTANIGTEAAVWHACRP